MGHEGGGTAAEVGEEGMGGDGETGDAGATAYTEEEVS